MEAVDDIVARYVDALGGKDVLSSIRSIVMQGTSSIMGSDRTIVVYLLVGKGFKTEMEFNGKKIVNCYTPGGGWLTNPAAGQSLANMAPAQVKAGQEYLEIGGSLFNFHDKGNKVELIDQDTDLYHLRVTTKDGIETEYYIDPPTYYLRRMVGREGAMGEEVEVTTTYSDYRKTDFGYVVAYSTELDFGSLSSTTVIFNKVEINEAIDPAIFDIPRFKTFENQ